MLEPNIKGPFWAEPVIEYVAESVALGVEPPPPQPVKNAIDNIVINAFISIINPYIEF
jgi:hypothetical protein